MFPAFHRGWQRRIAESLMTGVASEKLVEEMVLSGFDREFAKRQVAECESTTGVEAGRAIFQRQGKRRALFEAMAETARQSHHGSGSIKKVLTAEDFYHQYFWRNTPVVLQNLMIDWPALERWTPEFFAEHYGNEIIEITSERESDPLFEANLDQHRSRIKMRDYIRRIKQSTGPTNDFYLVAKNGLMANAAFRGLLDDIRCPAGLLDPATANSHNISLWFGPAGTVTPLHHDGSNILLGQIMGRKLVKLISPFFLDYLYNTHACFSDVDLEQIDYGKFPLMKNVEIVTLTLEAGEFLFIPIGWWHWIKSLEISISLSFQNFIFKNGPIVLESQ
ncbi:MAG TPA: cupin-like domain-containing protein [Candidatus Angelobacter sp.]